MTSAPQTAVIVRAARPDELPAVIELTGGAFGERVRQRATSTLWGDSTLRPGDIRVAEVNGRLVASLRIADRPIAYGAATLRLAGIGGVATHPDVRHHGYASLVMRDAAAAMKQAGHPLGMLFTGIPAFYARLGWVALPQYEATWPVGPEHTAASTPTPFTVRPFEWKRDLASVEQIYAEANRYAVGPCRRLPQTWQDEQAKILGIMPFLVAERDGQVVAYVRCHAVEESLFVGEAGCVDGEIAAYRPLAAAIWHEARTRNLPTLRAHAPRGSGLIAALSNEGGEAPTWHAEPHAMFLLLDLAALLHAATPELQHRWTAGRTGEPGDVAIGLRVGDDYARIVIRDGETRIDTELAGNTITIPPELFFRIFLGEQSATVLRQPLALAGAALTPAQLAILDRLFPQRDPIYWFADHF